MVMSLYEALHRQRRLRRRLRSGRQALNTTRSRHLRCTHSPAPQGNTVLLLPCALQFGHFGLFLKELR